MEINLDITFNIVQFKEQESLPEDKMSNNVQSFFMEFSMIIIMRDSITRDGRKFSVSIEEHVVN